MAAAALRKIKRSVLAGICNRYRTLFLKRPHFIAVTGSCGKTTTKDLIAAVLSSRLRGRGNPGTCNTPYHVVRMILKTKPRDDFCVLEVAGADTEIIPIEQPLSLIRPKIGVITNIGMDHFSLFGSREAIAEHKGKLVAALPADGVAVLNADDPLVMAMQDRCRCRVITYGLTATADFRATDISCAWPNRLSFIATHGNETARVETQLCGTHLTPNILAAMAVGHAMGISLADAAASIRQVPPSDGRMSPVVTADGITFLRDDQKAPLWTIPASLEFMRCATAERKVIVLGTISDFQGNPARKYPQVARKALEVAETVVFVGNNASMGLRAKQHANDKALYAFANIEQTLSFLQGHLRRGDLVLLKGSDKADCLERIAARWDPNRSVSQSGSPTDSKESTRSQPQYAGTVVVGLGNPQAKYRNTPHNVGQVALDLLARRYDSPWLDGEWGSIAQIPGDSQEVLLLKPRTAVNDTGPLLLKMADKVGFGPESMVIVQDDLAIDFGEVRPRSKGSAGGHLGVQSILVAFQSERIRRVKIGVGKPAAGQTVPDFVLTPFGAEQQAVIDSACEAAADALSDMLALNKNHESNANGKKQFHAEQPVSRPASDV